MKDAERIAELEAALRRSELLVEQLQAQLNLRRKKQPVAAPATPTAQVAVPDGYALVPVEPTAEMMMHESSCQHHAADDMSCPVRRTRRNIWARMLAAAPAQPAVQETYPECDYCGATPDHHPWHGSGLLAGVESRHIHACDSCRHLLPASPAQSEVQRLREALEFYARGDHLLLADPDAWDTCSGEPMNWLHDDEGTASVEDGSLAKAALAASTGQEIKP